MTILCAKIFAFLFLWIEKYIYALTHVINSIWFTQVTPKIAYRVLAPIFSFSNKSFKTSEVKVLLFSFRVLHRKKMFLTLISDFPLQPSCNSHFKPLVVLCLCIDLFCKYSSPYDCIYSYYER